jgi:glycerol uptake facilitator-like aquaporin
LTTIFFLICLGLLIFRESASDSGAALNPAVALSFSVYAALFKNDVM